MKQLKLPNHSEPALLDDEDFEKYSNSKYKWRVIRENERLKSVARKVWVPAAGSTTTVLLHREILGITDPSVLIDHKNNNVLDNQKHNLRTCSNTENQQNSVLSRKSTTGFKGVYVSSGSRYPKWYVQIRFGGRKLHVGQFTSVVAAAEAYDTKALELFGEFAKTNRMLGLL